MSELYVDSKLAEVIANALKHDHKVITAIYDYYDLTNNKISWDMAGRLANWYTKFRPVCSACVATYGEENVMPADIAHHSNLIADEWVFLCADHACQRGYINEFGFPTDLQVVKSLHDPYDVEYVRRSIYRTKGVQHDND